MVQHRHPACLVKCYAYITMTSHACHDVWNCVQLEYLFSSLCKLTIENTSKLYIASRVARGLNPTVIDGFPSWRSSNIESLFLIWCHQGKVWKCISNFMSHLTYLCMLGLNLTTLVREAPGFCGFRVTLSAQMTSLKMESSRYSAARG